MRVYHYTSTDLGWPSNKWPQGHMRLAGTEPVENPRSADVIVLPPSLHAFWSVLDNQQRPGITFSATLAFNPYTPVVKPVTRTAEFKFGQSEDMPGTDHGYLMVSGRVMSKKALRHAQPLSHRSRGDVHAGKHRAGMTVQDALVRP